MQEQIVAISEECSFILENLKCPPAFEKEVNTISELLLSEPSSKSPLTSISEEYQGLIYLMCKVLIRSRDCLPKSTVLSLFRAIISFLLFFFSADRSKFNIFIHEFPKSFASPYIHSLFKLYVQHNSLAAQVNPALLSLSLLIYFSSEPSKNPFISILQNLKEPFYIFDSLLPYLDLNSAVLILYTIMNSNTSFKEYCLSSSDCAWCAWVAEPLSSTNISAAEIRLDVLLMVTSDPEFCLSLSQSKADLAIISSIFDFLKMSARGEMAQHAVQTALSVLVNLGQKLTGFTSPLGEQLIIIMKYMNGHCFEFLRIICLFIESVLVRRARFNIDLLIIAMREIELFKSFGSITEKSQDKEDFERSLTAIKIITQHFLSKLQEMKPASDYIEMKNQVNIIAEGFSPDTLMQIPKAPVYIYEVNELSQTLRFFRHMVVLEIKEMLT